jgi:hypothetical protein
MGGGCVASRVFDAIWSVTCNDFGVFQVDPQIVAVDCFKKHIPRGLVTLDEVVKAMGILEARRQWLPWTDRRSGLKWAILPRWGDEQTVGNPALNRDPRPPARILKRCSLRTRDFFARYSRVSRDKITRVPPPPLTEEEGGILNGGGEGVQGEGPEELRPLLNQLWLVENYPKDEKKDVDRLRRMIHLYGMDLVERVVGEWVSKRMDEPLTPGARPRSELWTWARKRAQWDAEDKRDQQERGAPRRHKAAGKDQFGPTGEVKL